MHLGPGPAGERAGNRDAGEAGPRAEIGPDQRLRRQRQELQRIGDVPRPNAGSVEAATRFSFCCRSSSSSTNFSRRSSVSRETGVSLSARFLSAFEIETALPAVCSSAFRGAFCRVAHARPTASAPPASCRRCCGMPDRARTMRAAASVWLRSTARAALRNRVRPAARNFRRADRPRRPPPGARDRRRTWRRSRSARRSSASSSPKRGQMRARSAIAIFGYDNNSNAVRRCPSLLSASP